MTKSPDDMSNVELVQVLPDKDLIKNANLCVDHLMRDGKPMTALIIAELVGRYKAQLAVADAWRAVRDL